MIFLWLATCLCVLSFSLRSPLPWLDGAKGRSFNDGESRLGFTRAPNELRNLRNEMAQERYIGEMVLVFAVADKAGRLFHNIENETKK